MSDGVYLQSQSVEGETCELCGRTPLLGETIFEYLRPGRHGIDQEQHTAYQCDHRNTIKGDECAKRSRMQGKVRDWLRNKGE